MRMLAGPPSANDFEVPKNKPVPMVPVDPQEVSPFGYLDPDAGAVYLPAIAIICTCLADKPRRR